jgi:Domain of unknown function (DUF4124)
MKTKRHKYQQAVLAFFGLIAMTDSAYAQIYKCVVNGKTEYSQAPCAPDARKLADRARTIDPSPPKNPYAWVQDQLDAREAREQAFRENAQRSGGPVRAPAFDAVRCDRAERDVKIERMKSGKNADAIKRAEKVADAECGRNLADEPATAAAPSPRTIPGRTHNPNPSITNCDQAGCWDTEGNRYNRAAGNTMFGPNGVACTRTASGLVCP